MATVQKVPAALFVPSAATHTGDYIQLPANVWYTDSIQRLQDA